MIMAQAHCPALLITAPSSNSGKTTVVAAMARYWSNQGKRVRVFKIGPDFIDPIFHELASGEPVYQLDIGMMGEAICKEHLYQAAQIADLILIEGVMGMFDGDNSSAQLAATFGVPLLAVIPASSMAQTFGAIVYGLAHYQDDVNLFGVIANYVGNEGHTAMLKDSLPDGIAFCGSLPHNPDIALPERHLGLVQAQEIKGIEDWLERAATVLSESCDLPLPAAVCFDSSVSGTTKFLAPHTLTQSPEPQPLSGKIIAVARDSAFSFIYRDNISVLEQLGAKIRYFSPLDDNYLPETNSLYLPGGYPELYLHRLSTNVTMIESIKQHINDGKPTLAECGGMLYLLEQLTTKEKKHFALVGAIAGQARMQTKLQGLGILNAAIGQHTLTGHCFHYSTSDITLPVVTIASQAGKTRMQEKVFFKNNTLASYVHWYFPSSPELIGDLFLGHLAMVVNQ